MYIYLFISHMYIYIYTFIRCAPGLPWPSGGQIGGYDAGGLGAESGGAAPLPGREGGLEMEWGFNHQVEWDFMAFSGI